jgi:serine/threonine-protein kinase
MPDSKITTTTFPVTLSPEAAERLERAGGQSIAASDRALTSGMTLSADGLRLEAVTSASLAREPLELGEVIGRGGMGLVHHARQRSVRRDVAVKRTLDGAPGALANLLKEAWVGGNLEHPNVVPVHALVELEGAPAVLMKRIDGTTWSAALRDPELLPAAERHDPLAYHLRIALAVCNAIGYAHRRGVLHLDIKPENVMLGSFGEICVLDWGLAAGSGPRAPSWLPSAREIREVSGTVDYMAPELAMAAGAQIDARTDVYLLGATLHEVVTGTAPHRGGPAVQRLFRAYQSEPQSYGPEVPAELVALLRRAMHRDPEQRFPSAEALRDALESVLAHRRGDAIVREAKERIAALEAAFERGSDEAELSTRFGAARFALREAREARPGHAELASLRAQLFDSVARWAMDAGRLELATSYLAERGEPSPELEARLAALRADTSARAEQVQRLETLAQQESLEVSAAFRRRATLLWAIVFFVGSVGYDVLERLGLLVMGYPAMLLHSGCVAAGVSAYVAWHRRASFRNHANAALFTLALLTFFLLECFWVAAYTLELPFRTALCLTSMFYLLVSGAVTTLLSTRFAWSPVVAAVGVLGAALRPDLAWLIIGAGASVALAIVGLSWPSPTGATERAGGAQP